MPPSFTITTPVPTIPASATGKAEVIFTVSNTSGVPSRAMAKLVPSGDTRAEWLSVAGESERDFLVNGNQQFAVIARVPPGVAEGNYPFRFDVVSARKSSEERVEGPVVQIAVPARPVPPPPKKYWWIIVAVIALLLAGGVAAYLKLRPSTDTTVATDTTATTDVPERQRVEKLAAAWFAATRDHNAPALVAMTEVPFYIGENFILASKSDVERELQLIVGSSDGSARNLVLRHIRPKTIAEWKAEGADPARDRVVSSLSMADTDWAADLGVGDLGRGRTNRLLLFVRFVDGEPKVIGIGD